MSESGSFSARACEALGRPVKLSNVDWWHRTVRNPDHPRELSDEALKKLEALYAAYLPMRDSYSEVDYRAAEALITFNRHLRGDVPPPGLAPESITKEAAGVLSFLASKSPILQTLDDIEAGTRLSRATAKNATDELIDLKYAHRPKGDKKGAALTAIGAAVATKLSTNLVRN